MPSAKDSLRANSPASPPSIGAKSQPIPLNPFIYLHTFDAMVETNWVVLDPGSAIFTAAHDLPSISPLLRRLCVSASACSASSDERFSLTGQTPDRSTWIND